MKLELLHRLPKTKKIDAPIIFLHGAWHAAWCWEKFFMGYFAEQGFENYALSLRNHGNSPKPKNINFHSITEYVEDLRSVVEQVGKEPIIIAHSMGGLVLQKYLEKYSCKAAVLMAAVPPSGVFRITNKLLFTKAYALPNLLIANMYGIVNSEKKAKWAFFSDDIDPTELTEYTKLIGKESYLAFLNMMYPNIKTNYHTKIPLLVVAAENDNIFTIKENESIARKYNADLIVMKGMAHDMMLDTKRQQAADEIISWLMGVG